MIAIQEHRQLHTRIGCQQCMDLRHRSILKNHTMLFESPGAYTDVMCKAFITLLKCIEKRQQNVSPLCLLLKNCYIIQLFASIHNGT